MTLQKIVFLILLGSINGCHIFPQKSEPGGLEIRIIGDPLFFVPSSVYTVEVSSSWNEFDSLLVTASQESGIFQVTSSDTSFSEECLNTVVLQPGLSRSRVQVYWAAPSSGCSNIQAAAKIQDKWVSVNRTICSIDDNEVTIKECCACDHAKYRLTFEGIWSSKTHPKDYPQILWMTHFSDVIGATHSAELTVWEEGKLASYGVQQMAEYGIVRELDNELRNQSKKIKTIVHAAGLWYPDVNSKTTTVFKVDPRKHLLSFASMFGPSPDWFVGLSKFDLCLSNCTWMEEVQMDLFPYDAGTDSGISYMSANVPTDPPERIQKITPMYPEDARSPFYDPINHAMSPFAKLVIKRENVYKKKCSDLTEEEILQEVAETDNTEDESRPECEVSQYSDWSACSVSCGKGIRHRSRHYLNPHRAKVSKCDRQLISKEMCLASLQSCPGESEEVDIGPSNGFTSSCETTPWTEWSDCSATCGIGMKFRSRELLHSDNSTLLKRCNHVSKMEKQKCMEPPCHSQQQKIPRACSVTEWSEWSPCSVSCGEGLRLRTRTFTSARVPAYCQSSGLTLRESLSCKNTLNCTIEGNEAQAVCLQDISAGPCRGAFKKWAYDKGSKDCIEFYYGGCRGNRNNFDSYQLCNNTCSGVKVPDLQNKGTTEKVDCVVGKWTNWSPCYPCQNGTKTKTRPILKSPQNGGRPCPALHKTTNCHVPAEFCQV